MDPVPDPDAPEIVETALTRGGLLPMLADLVRWQKVLLSIATCLMVTGLGMSTLGGETPPGPIEQGTQKTQTPPGTQPSTLLPDGPTPAGTGQTAESGAPPWSEAIFKYGFSFFVGFAVGFALRTFLKLTLLFTGMLVLAISGLAYGDFVIVQWAALDEAFTGFLARVGQQSEHFRTFITGSLPNAGLGTLGLVTGFKKKG